MFVYEVHYDNGECWEDHSDYPVAMFSTHEKAKDHIVNKCGASVEESGWHGKIVFKFPEPQKPEGYDDWDYEEHVEEYEDYDNYLHYLQYESYSIVEWELDK